MRSIRRLVNEFVSIIETTDLPLQIQCEFENRLMDVPLSKPFVAVGVKEIKMNLTALGNYAGVKDGREEYSVPAEVVISAPIYLPRDFNGVVAYELATQMVDVVASGSLPIYKATTGEMYFDRTFLCSVLPIHFYLRDRFCGNST
ncbi:MAG: hypothetical protein IKL44_03290 [Clostridia bacterium]|nr:hypothetical protein [Clostridia bacterium]